MILLFGERVVHSLSCPRGQQYTRGSYSATVGPKGSIRLTGSRFSRKIMEIMAVFCQPVHRLPDNLHRTHRKRATVPGFTAVQQSWRDLPNPYGFPSVGELALNVQPLIVQNQLKATPVGRDWLGVGFQKGDLVIGTASGNGEVYIVEDAVLKGSFNMPHRNFHGENLLLRQGSDELYQFDPKVFGHDPNQGYSYELQRIDPEWIGTGLSLFVDTPRGSGYRSAPEGFERVYFQRSKARVKSLLGGGRTKSLSFGQFTVIGEHLTDPSLLRVYREGAAYQFLPGLDITISSKHRVL